MRDKVDLVICGFGEIGRAVAAFATPGRTTLIVERNAGRAKDARGLCLRVLEADATDQRILDILAAQDPSTIVVCVGDVAGLHIVRQCSRRIPRARLKAACGNWRIAEDFLEAGAAQVVVPSWIAGQGLASTVIA